jgi:hypothetical protein
MLRTQPAQKKITIFGIFSKKTLQHPWLFSGVIIGIILTGAADLASPIFLKRFFTFSL